MEHAVVYQPDILVSARTAVFVIPSKEFENMKEIRLKILMSSRKCSRCWIIALASDVVQLTSAPFFWNPLAGLIRFYESHQPFAEMDFQLQFRLAVSYAQVASIVAGISSAERYVTQYRCHGNQDEHDQEKLLLYYPVFNAISAQMVLQKITFIELLALPIESIEEIFQRGTLFDKIKVIVWSNLYFKNHI